MSIHVTCECGTRLKAKDQAAGKRLRCPKCQASITVPAAENERTIDSIAIPSVPFASAEPPLPSATPAKKPLGTGALLAVAGAFISGGIVTTALFMIGKRYQPHLPSARAQSPPAASTTIRPKQKSVEALVDTKVVADPREQQLRTLLAKVDSVYAEDGEKIARIVVYMVNEMKEAGQSVTPAEALKGSLLWPMPGNFSREKQNDSFAEYSALYLTSRINRKLSHAQAIREMHYLASAVHLKSKQDPAPEFEAAFEAASPGCRLAMTESHDLIREDDPLAEYYGALVKEVAKIYGMEEKDVGGGAFLVIGKLQQLDQSTHPDQVLRAALAWRALPTERTGRMKFFEFLQKYEQVRENEKKTHAQACVLLLGKAPEDARPEL